METRGEAIAWLNARGNHAFEWDAYDPNAFGVASASELVDLDGLETTRILGKLVVVCPVGRSWEVRSTFNKPPTPSFKTIAFNTLEEAVKAAADMVTEENRGM
jgi:hypothetical protein